MVSIDDLLEQDKSLLCSDMALQLGISPVGTAIATARFILIDAPDPWPFECRDHPLLAPTQEQLRQSYFNRSRILLSRSQPGTAPRLQVFQRESTGCSYISYNFSSAEELASQLEQLPSLTKLEQLNEKIHLICVHEKRDACCGTKGRDLADAAIAEGYQVEQVSHIGGHRYAPTTISLPDGHGWAHADMDLLTRIENETTIPTDISKYRGWWGAKAGAAQQCVRILQLAGVSESEIVSIEKSGTDIQITTTDKTYLFNVEKVGREPIPQCETEAGGHIKFRALFEVSLNQENELSSGTSTPGP